MVGERLSTEEPSQSDKSQVPPVFVAICRAVSPVVVSAPARTRTLDPLIKSQQTEGPPEAPIPGEIQGLSVFPAPADPQLTAPLTGAGAASCRELSQGGSSPDPDLARIAAAWPGLPPHIRAAVLALVAAAR